MATQSQFELVFFPVCRMVSSDFGHSEREAHRFVFKRIKVKKKKKPAASSRMNP